jgi:hypothetical protein
MSAPAPTAAADGGAPAAAIAAFVRAAHAAAAHDDDASLACLPREALQRLSVEQLSAAAEARSGGEDARGLLVTTVGACAAAPHASSELLLPAVEALAHVAVAAQRVAAAQPAAKRDTALARFAAEEAPSALLRVLNLPPALMYAPHVRAAREAAMTCLPALLCADAGEEARPAAQRRAAEALTEEVVKALFRIVSEAGGWHATHPCAALARLLRLPAAVYFVRAAGGVEALAAAPAPAEATASTSADENSARAAAAPAAMQLVLRDASTPATARVTPAQARLLPYVRTRALAGAVPAPAPDEGSDDDERTLNSDDDPKQSAAPPPPLQRVCLPALAALAARGEAEDAEAATRVLAWALLAACRLPPDDVPPPPQEEEKAAAKEEPAIDEGVRLSLAALSSAAARGDARRFARAAQACAREVMAPRKNKPPTPAAALRAVSAALARGLWAHLGDEEAVVAACGAMDKLDVLPAPQDGCVQLLLAAAQAHPGSFRVQCASLGALLRFAAALRNKEQAGAQQRKKAAAAAAAASACLARTMLEATACGGVAITLSALAHPDAGARARFPWDEPPACELLSLLEAQCGASPAARAALLSCAALLSSSSSSIGTPRAASTLAALFAAAPHLRADAPRALMLLTQALRDVYPESTHAHVRSLCDDAGFDGPTLTWVVSLMRAAAADVQMRDAETLAAALELLCAGCALERGRLSLGAEFAEAGAMDVVASLAAGTRGGMASCDPMALLLQPLVRKAADAMERAMRRSRRGGGGNGGGGTAPKAGASGGDALAAAKVAADAAAAELLAEEAAAPQRSASGGGGGGKKQKAKPKKR